MCVLWNKICQPRTQNIPRLCLELTVSDSPVAMAAAVMIEPKTMEDSESFMFSNVVMGDGNDDDQCFKFRWSKKSFMRRQKLMPMMHDREGSKRSMKGYPHGSNKKFLVLKTSGVERKKISLSGLW